MEELRQEVTDLQQRVARLETVVRQAARTETESAAGDVGAARERTPENLESRIGSRIFNRVGIIAVLVGVGLFLKIAFDNRWLGSVGKVTAGVVAGLGLLAWSERFHKHGYDAFSYSLKAVGAGLLYLSLWAAWSLFHLLSLPVAGAAMVVVTAGIGWLAWARDSELLAFYAAIGGSLTPVLLSDGQDHEVSLFAYLLVLNAAALLLVAARPWHRLAIAAFAATAAYETGWYAVYYTDEKSGLTVVFTALFLVLFAAVPLAADRAGEAQTSAIEATLAVLNAVFALVASVVLFASWRRAGVALVLAAFYFALAGVTLGEGRRLAVLHVLTANGFVLTAGGFAIYAAFGGSSAADRLVSEQVSYSAWFMAFGALVLAVGFWRGWAALRWQGLIVLCISIAKVFLVDMRTLSQGYRVLSFLGLGALLLAVSFVYQKDWLSLRGSRG